MIIASALGAISLSLLVSMALSSVGYSIRGSANLLSVALIVVAVRAFRKPTFLKAFLGVVPSLESSPTASRYDQMILIHTASDEKFDSFSKYIVDSVSQRNRVIYFHQSDHATISEGLSRPGIDVTRNTLKGSLRLLTMGSTYLRKRHLDEP